VATGRTKERFGGLDLDDLRKNSGHG
jgi:hypothetical protein